MNILKEQGEELRSFWRGGFSSEVWRAAAAFFILILLGYFSCFFFPVLLDKVMALINTFFTGLDLTNNQGGLSALALFSNNLRACAVAILYGFLPFVYLSSLALGMNAVLLGVLAAYYTANGHSLLIYLAAVLPHGIFELPALVLSFSLGLFLCGQMTLQVKKAESTMPLIACLENAARLYLLIIVPLLAVSSLVEAYVTPYFAGLFI